MSLMLVVMMVTARSVPYVKSTLTMTPIGCVTMLTAIIQILLQATSICIKLHLSLIQTMSTHSLLIKAATDS